MSTERILTELAHIRRMLSQLLLAQKEINTPIWISEQKAIELMGRSREWLKKQRLGFGQEITLQEGIDWRRVNGRTPEYKAKSIEKMKMYVPERKTKTVTLPERSACS
jgi:hypothetical protein